MSKRNVNYLRYKDEVLRQHNYKCVNCGTTENLRIHHIVPVAVGGTDNITNLIPLCLSCHEAIHFGSNVKDYKSRTGKLNGGRKNKISFEEFDKAFEKYLNGEIGKRKFCELTGYGLHITVGKNPHYKKSLEIRGIVRMRNDIDIAMTNRKGDISEGAVVGYVKYSNGTVKPMLFHDTGENDVEYKKRGVTSRCLPFAERKAEYERKMGLA